jgi:hypothetical protein
MLLTSLPPSPSLLGTIPFSAPAEDANRFTKHNGAQNLALLRKLALMMLKRHPPKQSLACKQWNASLNPEFLDQVLVANANSGKL